MATRILSRHSFNGQIRWALDGRLLPFDLTLARLLSLSREVREDLLAKSAGDETSGPVLAPCDPEQEVWASGVTYLRSRQEREAESSVADVYARVYDADRPEIFFKSTGWRVVGNNDPIRIRRDSDWNVPEPELVLVLDRMGEIVGYTAGNDVSSRSIEGENPLYLPQAKTYDGSCAVGSVIVLCDAESLNELPIQMEICRAGASVYRDETSTKMMRRRFDELAGYLFRETSFPNGVLLMTGTGIVPSHPFTLLPGDEVRIKVGEVSLTNIVAPNS